MTIFGAPGYNSTAKASKPAPTSTTCTTRDEDTVRWLARVSSAGLVLQAIESWSYHDKYQGLQRIERGITRVSPSHDLARRWGPSRFQPVARKIGGVR